MKTNERASAKTIIIGRVLKLNESFMKKVYQMVAGPGFEPGPPDYEPGEVPFLHPASNEHLSA